MKRGSRVTPKGPSHRSRLGADSPPLACCATQGTRFGGQGADVHTIRECKGVGAHSASVHIAHDGEAMILYRVTPNEVLPIHVYSDTGSCPRKVRNTVVGLEKQVVPGDECVEG